MASSVPPMSPPRAGRESHRFYEVIHIFMAGFTAAYLFQAENQEAAFPALRYAPVAPCVRICCISQMRNTECKERESYLQKTQE